MYEYCTVHTVYNYLYNKFNNCKYSTYSCCITPFGTYHQQSGGGSWLLGVDVLSYAEAAP